MTSYIEMSLEDIIRKTKGVNTRFKSRTTVNPTPRKTPPKKVPIVDARNRIISKKRTQITDAREKLAQLAKQKDARQKLEQLKMKRQIPKHLHHGMDLRNMPTRARDLANKERIFINNSRQVMSHPLNINRLGTQPTKPMPKQLHTKRFLESRSIESRSLDNRPKLKPILRTVENDLRILDDPMDVDSNSMQSTQSSLNRQASLQLRIVARNDAVMHGTRSSGRRLATPERVSPPRLPSILKKRAIASLRSDKISNKPDKSSMEYRIIVSNLRSTVTGGDIEELFSDVGNMLESRLVRPGTAEVIYKSLEDALRAVELYHNRQLDGQPMNCLLVTPRPTVVAPATARIGNKPAMMNSSTHVEPDISTFHKVLFSNL